MKYESSVTYHSKAMANVQVFCGQTNRQMDGPKTIFPRSIDAGGHKNEVIMMIKGINANYSICFVHFGC